MSWRNQGLNVAGLRSNFFERMEAIPTVYGRLATRIESTKDSESYKWLGSIPSMREWGDGRLARGIRTESYSVVNQKYESTIEVDRDEIADDQTGQIKIRIAELASRAAIHKDYMIGQLLINGAASGYNSYDGVTFFNTAHVSGDSGNQSNNRTSTAATPTVPTVEEFRLALRTAIAAMRGFVDDVGMPINTMMSGIVAIVPPLLEFTAREALQAGIIEATTNTMSGLAEVMPFPFLTGSTVWYLAETSEVRPFIFQDREPIEFDALEANSDEGFRREKFLYGVRARYRMTYGLWQKCVKMTFVAP